MEKALQHGESMEFFIEGARSRTGKACPPKGGLMSVVVDILNKGKLYCIDWHSFQYFGPPN